MQRLFALLATVLLIWITTVNAQTPINMASQPNFSYTESFTDIANWTFNADGSGLLTAGIGAAAWKGNAVGGSGSIPNGTRLTHASTSFQISGNPNQGSSSGLYKGTQNINLISTGTTDNTSAIAFDFFVNFSNVNAGTLSFDWASLNNSTGNRAGSLRIYTSTDGVNFTELVNAAVLNFVNNAPTNGSVSFAALPSSLNNNASAIIRFYYHNGTGGNTGSRPRISIDNVSVTATPTNTCTIPTAQPTNLVFSNVTTTSLQGVFAAANPAPLGYLVLISENSTLSILPANNKNYAIGDNIGDATVAYVGAANSFTVNNLNANKRYYFFVFSMNNICTGGPLYLLNNSLQNNVVTLTGNEPCTTPTTQATAVAITNIQPTTVTGTFTYSASATHYLVLRSTASNFTGTITNGTMYNAGTTIGNATVVSFSTTNTFTASNLQQATNYYFYVIAANNTSCSGGPVYFTSGIPIVQATTTSIPVCAAPTQPATNLQLTADSRYINGYFKSSASADGYLVLISTTSTLSTVPQNNITYNVGNAIGNATVVYNGKATAFIANALQPATTYNLFIVAYNSNCTGGIKYQTTTIPQASITTLGTSAANIYYGNLHAHSSFSDGNQDNLSFTPANNYAFAKNSLCMDFLGISDHNHSTAGMSVSNWQPGITQATTATTASFVGLYGMEWGVISGGGHVLVYGSNDLLGWETGNFNRFVARNDYIGTASTGNADGLFATINRLGNNAVALLAHPNNSDYNNLSNITFNAVADSAVVGIALANGPSSSLNINYSDPGSSLAYYDYFKKMLARGYRVAPSIDHDNHNTTFGRTAYSRLAVVAPSLTQNGILASLKSRSFYATEDCDARVIFTLNNQPMGSVLTGTTVPAISIYTIDPTSSTSIPNIKIMYGIPGNSVLAEMIDSVNAYTFNFTHTNLPNNTNAYYYAEITIDGNKIISAPIWYTYNDVTLPVSLQNFTAALQNNNTVALQWQTLQEVNNKGFWVEKSADGISFKQYVFVVGKNNSSTIQNYVALDNNPYKGTTFYRLQQVDNDGKTQFSSIVSVNNNVLQQASFQLLQNPVQQILPVAITVPTKQTVFIQVVDAVGKIVQQQSLSAATGKNNYFINNQLVKGTYTIKVIGEGWSKSTLFIK